MPALVHNSFRISNAKQFKESFHELAEHGISGFVPGSALVANTSTGELEIPAGGLSQSVLNQIPSYALDDQMYLFIGRVTPWTEFDTPDGSVDPNINENNPPTPVDSVKHGNFDHWDDMIAAKKVNGTDVSHVIKRERPLNIQAGMRGWEAGQRFDEYDDRSDVLFDDDMMLHALNERFRVYKCMKTGVGRFKEITGTGNVTLDGTWVWDYRSYDEPLTKATGGTISDDYLVAGKDGYQWKYFYTISAGEALKFVTTSYIPVRTVRKENGIRTNDFSDQYEIEENAIDGAILNVIVDRTPVVNASEILGYEPLGGDGYYQFAANATMTYNTSSSNTMSFSFADSMIQDCLFPGVSGGATGANNIFDFTSGNAASMLASTDFEGYGVIVTNNALFTRYVYPIKTYSNAAGTITIVADDDFIGQIKGSGIPLNNTTYQVDIEIHPWIAIESNYNSSSTQSPVDRLQAYCIVEPFFDHTTGQYNETEPGRIIDVKVLNGGNNHFRIDSTMVMPDISANATPATVHACVAPVGGHGFDPVAELGGYNVMINARFEGSESNEFTVGNEFRKIGILKNPLTWDATNLWMGASNYAEIFRGVKNDQCYRINLAGDAVNSGNTLQAVNYQPDMVVEFKQNTAPLYPTVATATLVDHDDSLKRIRVIEPRGDFATVLAGGDFVVESNTLHTVVGNTILSYTDALNTANTPGMKPGSGNILYLENRSIVSRSPNQSEDLKISIQF